MSGVPVAGRFYGEVDDDQVQQSRYFDQSKKMATVQSSIAAAKQAGDGQAMLKMIQEHPEVAMIKAHDRVAAEIAKLNKAAVTVINNPGQVKAIDDARVANMKALNTAMKQLEDASGKVTLGQRLRGAVRPAEVATQ
jgi:glucosamine 6-phosphate synthetase-like amidotransferase/phosphosugar isomerase protein